MVTAGKFTEKGCPMFEGVLQPMHLVVIVGPALFVFGPRDCLSWPEGSAMAYGDLDRQ